MSEDEWGIGDSCGEFIERDEVLCLELGLCVLCMSCDEQGWVIEKVV